MKLDHNKMLLEAGAAMCARAFLFFYILKLQIQQLWLLFLCYDV